MKILKLILLLLIFSSANGTQLHVGVNQNIKSITQAVEKAKALDSIYVSEGIYKEDCIVINKALFLFGNNKAVIDGQHKKSVIAVTASHVTINGFIIQNSGYSDIREYAGIRLENVKFCTISNNQLLNDYFGIYLENSSFNKIIFNEIHGIAKTESSSGNGIHLWKSSYNVVSKNNISGHRDGIYFEFVKHSFITGNLSEKNLRYGLHFMFSDYDEYQYNIFRKNGAGVAVMYTRYVYMAHNRFEDNWGSSSYGLLLKEISHSEIVNNRFFQNTIGIYMEGTATTVVHRNQFIKNGWAIRLLGDCADDTIMQNNFNGNTFDVGTNATNNMNFISSNYWDNYSGYDLNHNGVGDIPYYPVSLFSKLTEESPYALMLLHSFFVDLMNQTESMMPAIIPEAFIDKTPLMKPVKL